MSNIANKFIPGLQPGYNLPSLNAKIVLNKLIDETPLHNI